MRTLSVSNLYYIKHKNYQLDGPLADILGEQPMKGVWLILGKEKHGKSSVALFLGKYFSNYRKVLYVSGEEGTDSLFIDALKRSGINISDKNFGLIPYTEIEVINEKLSKRRSEELIIIDNMTIYDDEFKRGGIKNFLKANEGKHLIFISHEDRNEPSTAAGKYVKKIAKVIIRVVGLQAHVGGRCPGGILVINPANAERYGIASIETFAV